MDNFDDLRGHDMTVSKWCHLQEILDALESSVPGVFWGSQASKSKAEGAFLVLGA